MDHKRELATYLSMGCMAFHPKLDAKFFMRLLNDYEKDHEGQTALRGK